VIESQGERKKTEKNYGEQKRRGTQKEQTDLKRMGKKGEL